jgi:ATP-dependent Lon protease
LLEVLDPEQNVSFRDHYLDVPFDLSKVLFIATANVPDTIPGPLLDRMEVIRLSGYIMEEKLAIARRHLVPRLLPIHGLEREDVRFTPGGLKAMITGYAREAGVRALEKSIRACLRKVAVRKAAQELTEQEVINARKVDELLGKPVYHEESMLKQEQRGVAMGLAWTPLGGTVLFVEAMALPGKYGLRQTGQLGDVMTESSSIAFSMVHSNVKRLGIAASFFEEHTIHLHVPAGATPKDGPSAGVTMATALISLAKDQPVPRRLAMTGELTLTGAVLPVGGIKEKIIAAVRARITDVIMPAANERDFEEIPERVRCGIRAHFVSGYGEIYRLVFQGGMGRIRQAGD